MSTTMELDLWPPAAPGGRDPGQAGPAGEPVTRSTGSDEPGRPVVPAPRGVCRGGERGTGRRSSRSGGTVASPRSGGSTVSPRAAASRGGGAVARTSRAGGAGSHGGAGAPPSRDALALLRQAADQLAEAHRDPDPMRRYPAAYLAALRAGAAVLAMRARPRPRRGAPRDVWRLLAEVAPELEEWASFFASCSRVRAAAEAGIERMVDRRGADDLLRQAEQFVGRVQQLLPR
ncbi:SAV_6107 family HEPN domain-containing protein [Pseudonocardia sp. NPDC046786]|uniref:SAV_6107 family HEPN domain-containing protein n=1 Tax=Pseudonocardia sp. NPDC046786 TaxID=3155471 RepID=UPI0033EA7370